jgi:hypothetical protein
MIYIVTLLSLLLLTLTLIVNQVSQGDTALIDCAWHLDKEEERRVRGQFC